MLDLQRTQTTNRTSQTVKIFHRGDVVPCLKGSKKSSTFIDIHRHSSWRSKERLHDQVGGGGEKHWGSEYKSLSQVNPPSAPNEGTVPVSPAEERVSGLLIWTIYNLRDMCCKSGSSIELPGVARKEAYNEATRSRRQSARH